MKSTTLLSGLFIYVIVCFVLGVLDYYIPFMSDNNMINVAIATGILTVIIVALRDNAYEK